jgi:putative flippase GtrA
MRAVKTLPKLIRYAAVSAVSTVTALTLLGLLVGVAGAPAGWSNALATAIATVPSFELIRRWVWGARASRSLLRQAAPFFALSLSGLVLSTLTVHIAAAWATSLGWGRLARTVTVQATNLATFGVLWVFQYVLCDRLLFRSPPVPVESRSTPA